ncbi:MAG: DNA translocase FtsK 4TM domain-containing protein [Rhodospirillaceae bacterium]
MATSTTQIETGPFLPPSMVAAIRRALWAVAGLGILSVALAALVSLLTYSSMDPSLNAATNAEVQNWLGDAGAVFADAILQSLGLAAMVPVIVVTAWGTRVLRAETVSWMWLRLVSVPAAALFLSIGFAGFSQPDSWALPAGVGGFSGHILLDLITTSLSGIGAVQSLTWLAVILGLAGGLALLQWITTIPVSAYKTSAQWVRREASRSMNWVMSLVGNLRSEHSERAVERAARRVARKTKADKTPAVQQRERIEPTLTHDDFDEDDIYNEDGAQPAPASARDAEIVVARKQASKPSKKELAARQGSLLPATPEGFELPPLDILSIPRVQTTAQLDTQALESNAKILEGVLQDFGVNGEIVKVRPGPVVTLYELEPAPGTKTARVVSLADDIARSMSAVAVRIAVVPGRSVIGIELPNERRETVYFREMLSSEACDKFDGKLTLALGKDIGGAPVYADLARMPHLLIAGTTGSGKSVAINTMIMSLLYRHTPDDVRILMIDPKMLELSVYDGIPHLLSPVVTEPSKAVTALKWVVREMEDRYRAMSQLSVRNIAGYNQRLKEASKKGKVLTKTVQTGFDMETGKPVYEEQELDLTPLPYIVVIIDEMADLMLVAGKDVEAAVQRLAQMARAAGIHVIMATQRPSVDVITGTIKANFPTRISFQVTSKIDSRTILGEQGAEQLLGQGDMLYMAAGGRVTRVHGPFVTDEEVEEIVTHLKDQGQPSYLDSVTDEDAADLSDVPGFSSGTGGNTDSGDSLFDQAVALVARERKASTSFVQRHLQIGYNRAARIIEDMEAQGMIGKPNHVGKREVLLPETAER